MTKEVAVLVMMILLGGIACDTNHDANEPVPGLLPTSGTNESTGCGTASTRTAALEATRKFIPEKATVTLQGNCVLAVDDSHLTTFTSIRYSIEAAASNQVCAIVDSYQNAANDVTAVTSLFYAEWYAGSATSSTWGTNCGGPYPDDTTNTNEVCHTPGFANPVTGTKAFQDLMTGKIKAQVFSGCTWAYASPFTE